jgi:hypothetical protein
MFRTKKVLQKSGLLHDLQNSAHAKIMPGEIQVSLPLNVFVKAIESQSDYSLHASKPNSVASAVTYPQPDKSDKTLQ